MCIKDLTKIPQTLLDFDSGLYPNVRSQKYLPKNQWCYASVKRMIRWTWFIMEASPGYPNFSNSPTSTKHSASAASGPYMGKLHHNSVFHLFKIRPRFLVALKKHLTAVWVRKLQDQLPLNVMPAVIMGLGALLLKFRQRFQRTSAFSELASPCNGW